MANNERLMTIAEKIVAAANTGHEAVFYTDEPYRLHPSYPFTPEGLASYFSGGYAPIGFASTAQGLLASTALQPYQVGALAYKNTIAISYIETTGTPNNTTFLRGDGTWSPPTASGGDVLGPNSSADANIAVFSGTTGKIIVDSSKKLSDLATSTQGAKADTAVQSVTGTGVITVDNTNTKTPIISTTADNTATTTHAVTAKSTPIDADELPLLDSASSFTLKKFTWANLKTTLKSYLDTLYQPLDSDLTTIAGFAQTNGNFIQSNGTSWISAAIASASTTVKGIVQLATAAQYRASTAGFGLSTDQVWIAATPTSSVNLTGTVTLDFSTFINHIGVFTNNVTLGATSNLKQGQSGIFEWNQDATGGRTLALNTTYWATAGGAVPSISTAASAKNRLAYYVQSDGKVLLSLAAGAVA